MICIEQVYYLILEVSILKEEEVLSTVCHKVRYKLGNSSLDNTFRAMNQESFWKIFLVQFVSEVQLVLNSCCPTPAWSSLTLIKVN